MDVNYYRQYEPIFGAWTIKRKLGEGNFGAVYEIEREDFGTTYRAALKTITIPKNQAELDSILDDGMDVTGATQYLEQFVEKIVGEFVLMSKLKGNSHIVSYEDHQVIKHKDGIGWDILIRMELLTPLMTHMKTTSVTKRDVIQLGIDMCRALELCQKYNIIHRDIKPENIFIADSGDFKLGDFGIAKEVEKTQSGLTKTGTQTYMAPEVYKGQPYGSSVDIYSLGIVLYRLLNHNRAPFMPQYPEPISYSDRERALIMRMGGHKFPMPSGVADSRLAEIALKACSFKPEDRYSSPTQMREDLEAILYTEGEGILMFPSGDALEIKSVEYVSNSKAPNATERIGDEATEVMDDDATEIMEKARKQFSVKKGKSSSSQRRIVKIVTPIVCAGLIAAGGAAYYFGRGRIAADTCMVTTQAELNSPIAFTIAGTVSDSDYTIIEKRLEAYGCPYYLDKERNVIAMGKADLGSNNQEILATIHMLLGKGEIKISNAAGDSEYSLSGGDIKQAVYRYDEESACNIAEFETVESEKTKLQQLTEEIMSDSKNKLVLSVDENERWSCYGNAPITNGQMLMTSEGAEPSPQCIKLIVSLVNDGVLSKTYDAAIDEAYGITLDAAAEASPEDNNEETATPESEDPVKTETESGQSTGMPQATKKISSAQSSNTRKNQPAQQPAQQPTQQETQQQPAQQAPVQQQPVQQTPVQQPATNEDIPEIFDPTFD